MTNDIETLEWFGEIVRNNPELLVSVTASNLVAHIGEFSKIMLGNNMASMQIAGSIFVASLLTDIRTNIEGETNGIH